MPKFKIEATRTVPVFVIVEADNLEEAEKMYDYDLIADDYQEDEDGLGCWKLDDISEIN